MRPPGWDYISGLAAGRNVVVMAGPLVLKRTGQPDPRRKYFSEIIGRRLLDHANIRTVPVRASLRLMNVLVMQRAKSPTLDRHLSPQALSAFTEHVLEFAAHRLPPWVPPGYGWLDTPQRIHCYRSFTEFLINESQIGHFQTVNRQYDVRRLREQLEAADPLPERLLVLTDIAPKNVVYHEGEFAHLDLEMTALGPPDFLLVKAAVNLASDLGDRFGAREARERILQRVGSLATARAVLMFSLLRRMVFEARARVSDPRAGRALDVLIACGDLADAIGSLENSWGAASRRSLE